MANKKTHIKASTEQVVAEETKNAEQVVAAEATAEVVENACEEVKAERRTTVAVEETYTDAPEPPSISERVKTWTVNLARGIKDGCAEIGRFISNPSRYIKASKGKNYLAVKSDDCEIVHDENNVLEVRGVKKYFPIKKGLLKRTVGYVRAVDGVSFDIKAGTTMGLVGESGCGKTTVGRTILRLIPKTSGEILFGGKSLTAMTKKELRAYRPNIQIVFQDPYSSLSPRMPVGEIIGEAVRQHGIVPPEKFDDYISKIMRDCGLQEYHKNRYPHEFSGGQRQRICIARALALNPKFIVCDEPVSALDVSIQAQIINLLKDLQKKYRLTYLFISHDLSVVEHISDTVGVMYLGSMVEYADTDKVFSHPLHPYTEALFSAIPVPDPDYKMNRIILEGSIPSPANPPNGCKFHTRCRDCREVCKHVTPTVVEAESGHFVACHKYCSQSDYNNPEYAFDEPRTPEFVQAELAAKTVALYADVPKTKAQRKKAIEAELDRELRRTEKAICASFAHKTDLLEHDRVISSREISRARALMYQKLTALPKEERESKKRELDAELKAEIERIKLEKANADAEIKAKAGAYAKEREEELQKARLDNAQKLAEKIKALDAEIPESKAETLSRDCEACSARAKVDSKELKKQYRKEIKQLVKERDDRYIAAYNECKLKTRELSAKNPD